MASPPVIITNLFVYSNRLLHCRVYYYQAASTRRISRVLRICTTVRQVASADGCSERLGFVEHRVVQDWGARGALAVPEHNC